MTFLDNVITTPWLQNSIESPEYPSGVYIVASFHEGNTYQNWFSVIVLTGYEDKWYNTESPFSYITGTNYNLQFNPKLKKLRNTTANGRIYLLFKLA